MRRRPVFSSVAIVVALLGPACSGKDCAATGERSEASAASSTESLPPAGSGAIRGKLAHEGVPVAGARISVFPLGSQARDCDRQPEGPGLSHHPFGGEDHSRLRWGVAPSGPRHSVFTDEQGVFEVEGVQRCRYHLVVGVAAGIPPYRRVAVASQDEVVLEAPVMAEPRVVVVRANGGGPIAGATVRMLDGYADWIVGRTGEDGRLELTPTSGSQWFVGVEADGFASRSATLRRGETMVRMDPGHPVSGRVLMSGRPVAGARVTVEYERPHPGELSAYPNPILGATDLGGVPWAWHTDAAGEFSTSGLAGKRVRISATHGLHTGASSVSLLEGPVPPVGIELGAASKLVVWVTDEENRSIEGASVSLRHGSFLEPLPMVDGRAEAEVMPGSVSEIEVSADGYERRRISVDVGAGETARVEVGLRTTEGVLVRIEPPPQERCTLVLSRLRDEDGLGRVGQGRGEGVTSSGKIMVEGLENGRYLATTVNCSPPSELRMIEVPGTKELTLRRGLRNVTVQVVDDFGEPVRDTRLFLTRVFGPQRFAVGNSIEIRTGDDGITGAAVAPGTWRVSQSRRDAGDFSWDEVILDEDTPGVRIHAVRGRRLLVHLIEPPGGRGGYVNARDLLAPDSGVIGLRRNSSGSWELNRLRPTLYEVFVRAPHGQEGTGVTVDLREAPSAELTFDLSQ